MQISESSIRRRANRAGYIVRKSRSRNPESIEFGGYMLIDADIGGAVLGGHPFVYSADLDEIREYLSEP